MKCVTTKTYEYDAKDIEALIKKDIVARLGGNSKNIKVSFHIESQQGYDGPGIPPQELTKVIASYNE
jgi:hypothetical protein